MKRTVIYLLLIAIVLTSMISCSSNGKADYNDFNEMPNGDITTDTENKFTVTKGKRETGRDQLGDWDQQIQLYKEQINYTG